MLSRTEAEAFAAEWIVAWNSHELARLLSHYAPDFEFSSPIIAQLAGVPSGRLRGHEAMGAYWGKALERFPELRFELESVLWGVNSLVICYRRFDGRKAAEWFEFGADGKVIRSVAQYGE